MGGHTEPNLFSPFFTTQHFLFLPYTLVQPLSEEYSRLDLSPIDLIHVNPLLSDHGEGQRVSAINVVVADQQKRIRSAYARQLRPEAGIAVVGEAATSYDVVKALKLKPQVLLLDWEISALHGMSILPLVRHQSPGTRVILLGERTSRRRLLDALSLGARGYLRKPMAKTFLPKAVRVVGAGEVWIPRTIVSTVLAAVGRISLKWERDVL